ncbi:hypothetical protein BCR33DRAFT_714754 [Rhizoclosmatium globosum]|uniref:Uncharacterized protein n=1 Tax=Rhizoclosmatium globosum TaxID=329046 RepID=A0A1Y2CKW1_9FUNG|nr:hypothetical protein BCR33DRAFT_714754 [Rhizoclosmatium globosum]|eukprot:ORY47653.1 hypothetical protein BCR33DRAFT_714754 [Rhizoclosmatium globosum]
MTKQLRATVFDILHSHGVYEEFIAELSKPLPPKPTKKDQEETADIWSIEIKAKEGICKFSKPLIIATEATPSTRVVRLAHSWADVWDVTYDPLYEYSLVRTTAHPNTWDWIPVNRYSTHQDGFTVFETKELVDEAVQYSEDWARVLVERGYGDVGQAQIVRLGAPQPVVQMQSRL